MEKVNVVIYCAMAILFLGILFYALYYPTRLPMITLDQLGGGERRAYIAYVILRRINFALVSLTCIF